MQITLRDVDGTAVIEAVGRVDSTTAGAFEAALFPHLGDGGAVILDLSGVTYISSAGLRVMLKAAKLAREHAASLLLAGAAPQVQDVFEISGCVRYFSMHPDVARALAASRGAA